MIEIFSCNIVNAWFVKSAELEAHVYNVALYLDDLNLSKSYRQFSQLDDSFLIIDVVEFMSAPARI